MFRPLFGGRDIPETSPSKKASRKLHESLGQHLEAKFRKEVLDLYWTVEIEVSRNNYKLLVVLGWNPERGQIQRINDECGSFAEKSKKSLRISGPHFVAGVGLTLFIGLE